MAVPVVMVEVWASDRDSLKEQSNILLELDAQFDNTHLCLMSVLRKVLRSCTLVEVLTAQNSQFSSEGHVVKMLSKSMQVYSEKCTLSIKTYSKQKMAPVIVLLNV